VHRDGLTARGFVSFGFKGAHLRICSERADVVTAEVVRLRAVLEAYIVRHPDFVTSLVPIALLAGAPEIARRMAAAGEAAGVGPMAAVAGAIAQMAGEAALGAGAAEAIVENGGDNYLASPRPVTVALYAGAPGVQPLGGRLAMRVVAARMPLAICSSSGLMGHSLSLGRCDLATVIARDAALADAAATLAGNSVTSEADIGPALETVMCVAGVSGVLIIKGGRVGLAGDVPELVRNADAGAAAKVSHDEASGFRVAEA
jgi:uncharacterized protein